MGRGEKNAATCAATGAAAACDEAGGEDGLLGVVVEGGTPPRDGPEGAGLLPRASKNKGNTGLGLGFGGACAVGAWAAVVIADGDASESELWRAAAVEPLAVPEWVLRTEHAGWGCEGS